MNRYVWIALGAAMLVLTSATLVLPGHNVKWGPEYAKPGIYSYFYLAGFDSKYYYVVSKPKSDNLFMKFDYNHRLVSEKSLPFEVNGKPLPVVDVISTKNKVFAVMELQDNKADVIRMYSTEISKDGNLVGKPQEVALVPHKAKIGLKILSATTLVGSLAYGYNTDASGIHVSSDSSRILIFEPGSDMQSGKESYSVFVFDQDFQPLWKRVTQLPYTDDRIKIEQFYISNDNVAYLTCKVWKVAGDRKKGEPNYEYKIIAISEKDTKEYELSIGTDKLISDAGVFFGSDQRMVIGGFYTEKSSPKNTHNGVFQITIDRSSAKVLSNTTYPFSADLLAGIISNRAISKDKGVRNFSIRHIVSDADEKNFAFVAEERYTTEHTTTTSNNSTSPSTSSYTMFHSDYILVPSFAADGSLNWVARVSKNFATREPEYTSYTLGTSSNGIYLVYNDAKNRGERAATGKNAGMFAIYTDMAFIDNNGKVTTETVFTSKDDDMSTAFIPWYSTFTGNNEFLLYGQRRRVFQYGTMKVE